VSRARLSNLLKLYDFPDPLQTSPGRDLTTTSLQQLFIMNSAFMREQAAALAKNADGVIGLYRRVLGRDPDSKELALAQDYLNQGTLEQYAQVLLASNEEIFWP
jgi:hypothetical protein